MGKTLKTVLLLLFMGLSIPATALELHVFLQNGDEEIVDLGSVENLDYDPTGEILQVHFTGGGQEDFLLDEIRKLTFSGFDAVSPVTREILQAFTLLGNYPNPFNNSTVISYDLPAPGPLQAEIFNIRGQRVRLLAEVPLAPAGRNTVSWDGLDDRGGESASGLYFCRVTWKGQGLVQRLLLLK